jgi:sarcosine oxidase, subunit gamma
VNHCLRASPFHARMQSAAEWMTIEGMAVPRRFAAPAQELSCLRSVALSDLSWQRRAGLKGPRAAMWLEARGFGTPASANGWVATDGGGRLSRLGATEFFGEDLFPEPAVAARCLAELRAGEDGVYPVLRQDAKLAIVGPRSLELLAEVCAVPLAADDRDRTVVMTDMAGISVIVWTTGSARLPRYEVLCDASFAPYLWGELWVIAQEQGGGAVGHEALALPETEF